MKKIIDDQEHGHDRTADGNSDSKLRPLREAIQQQVSSESLSPEQLQSLMALQQKTAGYAAQVDTVAEAQQQQTNASADRRRYWPAITAACFVLAISLITFWPSPSSQPQDFTNAIALEVVNNHLKQKPLDVKTASVKVVQQFFTQLDFSPIDSPLMESTFSIEANTMLGGRYCSIKGVTAAQLRFQQHDESLNTLYQVAYDPTIFGHIPRLAQGEVPKEMFVKGLRVSMWVEKGLLFVLVSGV